MNTAKKDTNKGLVTISFCMALPLTAILAFLVVTEKNCSSQGSGLAIGATVLAGGLLLVLLAAIMKKGNSSDEPGIDDERQQTNGTISSQTAIPQRSSEQKPALMLLTLLQEKGRFIDFLMEDIDQYPNERVGAAARVVHQGCREVVRTVFDPVPVSDTKEKSAITLDENYASEEYALSGSVGQKPPFSGKLLHRGWRAQSMKLPSHTSESGRSDSMVIVPAKVEV